MGNCSCCCCTDPSARRRRGIKQTSYGVLSARHARPSDSGSSISTPGLGFFVDASSMRTISSVRPTPSLLVPFSRSPFSFESRSELATKCPTATTSNLPYGQTELDQAWTSSQAYGCASFDVTNKATSIEWKGYGLKIQIPDDSVCTTARLDMSIHWIINNPESHLCVPYDLDDYQSVSALYSIKVGSGKLCKPVTIEIQHCSSLAAEQLTLLRASNEIEHFRPVADAVFDQRTNCGRVIVPKLDFVEDQEYDDFSWFMIAIRRLLFRNTIHYKAQVYISKTTMMMHFIITMALDLCSTVVKEMYNDFDLHTSFPVQFDRHGSGRISLDVPEGGTTLENGWVITPLYNPSIAKRLVDRFCIFHNDIPKCEFSLHCKRSPPARLEHRIILTGGTANGEKHFCINFKPPCTSDVSTATANDQSTSSTSESAANTIIMSVSECVNMTQGFQGELSEHTVPKYLHDIPSEDLVELGHTLGLRYNKLRRFKSTENFCLNLVSAWLREEDEVSERSGKPSWESLAEALEEIGQNGIARTIRDNNNIIANHQFFITTAV